MAGRTVQAQRRHESKAGGMVRRARKMAEMLDKKGCRLILSACSNSRTASTRSA